MIFKRAYCALPGPKPLRILLATVAMVVFLLLLNIVYDWMGNTFLDTGGVIN